MDGVLRSEETIKHTKINQRRYWCFFLPLAVILGLIVKFPLRFILQESLSDMLFYGSIALACIAIGIRVYRQFGRRGRSLIRCCLDGRYLIWVFCVMINHWLLALVLIPQGINILNCAFQIKTSCVTSYWNVIWGIAIL
jgi:hypothetical protein